MAVREDETEGGENETPRIFYSDARHLRARPRMHIDDISLFLRTRFILMRNRNLTECEREGGMIGRRLGKQRAVPPSIDSVLLTESPVDFLVFFSLYAAVQERGARYVRGIAKLGVFYYVARRRCGIRTGAQERRIQMT